MHKERDAYYIKVKGQLVDVSKQIYEAYYEMKRREKYLIERDRKIKLQYYDAWDSERTTGCEQYVVDCEFDTENHAIDNIEEENLWGYIRQLNDKYNICYLVSIGFSEREIAKISGISHNAVHKQKNRLFGLLKVMLKRQEERTK